jgi:GNAT superfamily N-acetyltransferase
MTIRQAEQTDIERLIELRFAFLKEFRHIGEAVRERLLPELRRYFSAYVGTAGFAALLGETGGRVVCTAFFTVSESPPNDQYPNGRIAYVFNVYTRPECRGRGYASKLVETLVATAKGMGVTAVNLNASAAGRPIYEKLGFKVLNDTAMRLQLHGEG